MNVFRTTDRSNFLFQEETNIRLMQERETAISQEPPSGAVTPTTPGPNCTKKGWLW